MLKYRWIFTAMFCLVVLPAAAFGTIIIDTEFPTEGEATRVRVIEENGSPVQNAKVSAIYRPGSNVERSEEVGQTGTGGTIDWTPSDAGIVTLNATWQDAEQKNASSATSASVRFAKPPIAGIIIMAVAGVILIIGSFIRVYRLMRTPDYY